MRYRFYFVRDERNSNEVRPGHYREAGPADVDGLFGPTGASVVITLEDPNALNHEKRKATWATAFAQLRTAFPDQEFVLLPE